MIAKTEGANPMPAPVSMQRTMISMQKMGYGLFRSDLKSSWV